VFAACQTLAAVPSLAPVGLSSDPEKRERQLAGLLRGAEKSGSTKAAAKLGSMLEDTRAALKGRKPGPSQGKEKEEEPGPSQGKGSPTARAVDRLEYRESQGQQGRKNPPRTARADRQGERKRGGKPRQPAKEKPPREAPPPSPGVEAEIPGFVEGLKTPFKGGGPYVFRG
jgi:hypothetical protein